MNSQCPCGIQQSKDRHFNNFLYKINSLYCILNSLSQLGYHITYLYFITLKQSKLASLQYHRTSFISSNSWSRLGSLWTRSSLKLMLNALQERVPALLHLAVGVFIQSLLLLQKDNAILIDELYEYWEDWYFNPFYLYRTLNQS